MNYNESTADQWPQLLAEARKAWPHDDGYWLQMNEPKPAKRPSTDGCSELSCPYHGAENRRKRGMR